MNVNTAVTSLPRMTVARYLAAQIAISDMTQKEIAEALGYENPNMVSMIKSGATKLPLNKVGTVAAVLHVDPRYLLRLALKEYHPDTWAVLEPVFDREFAVTVNEQRLLAVMRERFRGNDIDMSNLMVASYVVRFFSRLSAAQQEQEEAAMRRYNAAPPNAKLACRVGKR